MCFTWFTGLIEEYMGVVYKNLQTHFEVVLYLLLFFKIFVIVEIYMLKNIQKKKTPLIKPNPDLRIRTHARSDFIRTKT